MTTRTPITRASATAFPGAKLLVSVAGGRDAAESVVGVDGSGNVTGIVTAVATTSTTTPKLLTTTTVGTVTTGATTAAEEHGDGIWHYTKLTMTAFAVGTIPDNAALGFGASFYTFPAGTILVDTIHMVGGLTGAVSVTAQTPEVGIGSVIASGAVSVLSGTSTFEDYIDGNASGGANGATTAPDIAGTTFYKLSRNDLGYIIKTSGGAARELFLNVAATWADVAASGVMTYTGVITIKWQIVS